MDSGDGIGQDLPVDRTGDLDQAAAEIIKRHSAWQAYGLLAGPITWRDESAPWPQRLETDRSQVSDPDSVGIRITGPNDSELRDRSVSWRLG
ncbi:hypothetical protein [Actinacidiphila oryziradicis]|uniref:Uncharacterized protein n=1 Tax=Actinacidiphila oryziradicis TaxID=2571141 RepID=A0A4U0RL75_9ACTN|nr:hypothetical protein [Actinacidiphila oryziradicis]TJZ96046.1 hypothetical protein FCI23_51555 [Actinacidiphila oryziradicis]